jgi:hypothetical protein
MVNVIVVITIAIAATIFNAAVIVIAADTGRLH